MEKLLKYLDAVIEYRKEKKVRHKIGDIIALVFFAELANANEWAAIEIFGKEHEQFYAGTWCYQMEYRRTIRYNGYSPWYSRSF